MKKKFIYTSMSTILLSASTLIISSSANGAVAVNAPAPAGYTWDYCADQGKVCDPKGAIAARYLQANRFIYMLNASRPFVCGAGQVPQNAYPALLHPAIVSVPPVLNNVNHCERLVKTADLPPPVAGSVWVKCASQYLICAFTGTQTIAYGANGKYKVSKMTAANESKGVYCDNSVFGNPVPVVNKSCFILKTAVTPVPPQTVSSLSVSDTTANEADGAMTFTVTLSAASTKLVSVRYMTSNNNAVAGVDYTAASGLLSFQPGETRKTITIAIANDHVIEPMESFNVTLASSVGANIVRNRAVGAIEDNNDGSNTPTVSVGSASAKEGEKLVHTVTLSSPSVTDVEYTFNLKAGTAVVGSDFDATVVYSNGVTLNSDGTITVPAGVTSFTVSYATINDAITETSETTTLTIGGVANTGTIIDDDLVVDPPAPVLDGKKLFDENCAACHVTGAPAFAPDYAKGANAAATKKAIVDNIGNMGTPKLKALTAEEIKAIADFGGGTAIAI